MSNRRMAALRAMAEQDASPTERAIALEKLAAAERREALDTPRFTPAQDRMLREARAAEAGRAEDERQRAELVKRWERGEFAGLSVRMGGAVNEARFRRS